MSIEMDEEIKAWTARRRSALVLDIIHGKTAVSESSRQFDIPPSEIESWIDQTKSGMENALKVKSEDSREQYETQLKALQEAYGAAMLELRARKNGTPCSRRKTKQDTSHPAGLEGRIYRSDDQALSFFPRSSPYWLLQAR